LLGLHDGSVGHWRSFVG
jgi:hypothetical protein